MLYLWLMLSGQIFQGGIFVCAALFSHLPYCILYAGHTEKLKIIYSCGAGEIPWWGVGQWAEQPGKRAQARAKKLQNSTMEEGSELWALQN